MPEGEGYDRCDSCSKDVEAAHLSGGQAQGSAKHLEWSVFSCPPQDGGCGSAWSKTTRQGLAKREAQGAPTAGLTQSATTQRATSIPSDRYQRNYDLIQWDK